MNEDGYKPATALKSYPSSFKPWRPIPFERESFQKARDPQICKDLYSTPNRRLDDVNRLLESLDKGLLTLHEPIDRETIILLFFHKNARKIKEIRYLDWVEYNPKSAAHKYFKQNKAFKKISALNIPTYLFELMFFYGCVGQVFGFDQQYANSLPFSESIYSFDGAEIAGAFKTVEDFAVEIDLLRDRKETHPINYFTLFKDKRGSNSGFVYDYQRKNFSEYLVVDPAGDNWEFYDDNKDPWRFFYEIISQGFEDCFQFDEEHSICLENLSEVLKADSYGFEKYYLWFLNHILTGFLNFNRLEQRKLPAMDAERYRMFVSNRIESAKATRIFETYPRIFAKTKIDVNMSLSKNDLYELKDISEYRDQSELLSRLSEGARQLIAIEETGGNFLQALVSLAGKESKSGRPMLAVFLADRFWRLENKESKRIAGSILRQIPLNVSGKLIRSIVVAYTDTNKPRLLNLPNGYRSAKQKLSYLLSCGIALRPQSDHVYDVDDVIPIYKALGHTVSQEMLIAELRSLVEGSDEIKECLADWREDHYMPKHYTTEQYLQELKEDIEDSKFSPWRWLDKENVDLAAYWLCGYRDMLECFYNDERLVKSYKSLFSGFGGKNNVKVFDDTESRKGLERSEYIGDWEECPSWEDPDSEMYKVLEKSGLERLDENEILQECVAWLAQDAEVYGLKLTSSVIYMSLFYPYAFNILAVINHNEKTTEIFIYKVQLDG